MKATHELVAEFLESEYAKKFFHNSDTWNTVAAVIEFMREKLDEDL